MDARTALIVAGIVFTFVGLMHLMRYIYKIEVTIAGTRVPQWISILGFVIPFSLAVWMFLAS